MRRLLAIIFEAMICFAAESAPTVTDALEAKLLDKVRALEATIDGVVGVAAIDLTTGQTIEYRPAVVFPQASSIKIAIMLRVFERVREGHLRLGDTVTLEPREAVGGSGHLRLTMRQRPISPTLEEFVMAMIETSDNTATNKLIALVGMDSVNSMLDRLGFRATRLRRIMLDAGAAAKDNENVSTPLEMARIAELLYRGKAVDAESSTRMIDILKLVTADFRKAIPLSVVVASKPGGLTGVHCETGIVYTRNRPFALSVASTYLSAGENPVPAIAKLFYEHFEKLGRSNKFGNGGVR